MRLTSAPESTNALYFNLPNLTMHEFEIPATLILIISGSGCSASLNPDLASFPNVFLFLIYVLVLDNRTCNAPYLYNSSIARPGRIGHCQGWLAGVRLSKKWASG